MKMFKRMYGPLLVAALVLTLAPAALAKTVKLAWSASTDPNVVGYKVYYRADSADLPFNGTGATEGNSPIDVGSSLSVTLSNLPDNQVQYIGVAAYDAYGNESPLSNIVSSPAVVASVNQPPVMTAIAAQSVAENAPLSFTVSGSDPDGDALTYSAAGLPAGASFSAASRTFSWTPSYSQAGSYTVTFTVSDGSLSVSQSVSITVTNVDQAPVLAAIGAQSVAENAPLSFTVSGSDPDGDALTYSATGLPAGASFSAASRSFSWTPNYDQAGNYTVTFTVSDGTLSASQAVSITVSNVDRAPQISGTPPTSVQAGNAYQFLPVGSDPDSGDTLVYSITNKPAWASFDPTTGALTGTPAAGDAGVTSGIVIAVSDGTMSAALPPFDLTVKAAAAQSWTLSATADTGGYITPTGDTQVSDGGSQSYTILAKTGYSLTDVLVDGVSVGAPGAYGFTDVTANHTIEAQFAAVPDGLSLPADDAGLPGVERVDGGSDADNLVNGLPKAGLQYRFHVLLRQQAGDPPVQPWLVLDGYAYPMSEGSGDVTAGLLCTYVTPLGPAAAHAFHFEARDDQGNVVWRLPQQGDYAGPQIQLLNGVNLVGLSRDVSGVSLDPLAAFGSTSAAGWDSGSGSFVPVTSATALQPGEGYFVKRQSSPTLAALDTYGEVTSTSFTIPLHGGWNLIANPYGGNVKLADVQVQNSTNAPVTWQQAASNGWIANALFSYSGSDWGNSYTFASVGGVSEPVLVPWVGYWIYVSGQGGDFALVVSQPAR